jgi:hypothetical protein
MACLSIGVLWRLSDVAFGPDVGFFVASETPEEARNTRGHDSKIRDGITRLYMITSSLYHIVRDRTFPIQTGLCHGKTRGARSTFEPPSQGNAPFSAAAFPKPAASHRAASDWPGFRYQRLALSRSPSNYRSTSTEIQITYQKTFVIRAIGASPDCSNAELHTLDRAEMRCSRQLGFPAEMHVSSADEAN